MSKATPIITTTTTLSAAADRILKDFGAGQTPTKSQILNSLAVALAGPKHNWGYIRQTEAPFIEKGLPLDMEKMALAALLSRDTGRIENGHDAPSWPKLSVDAQSWLSYARGANLHPAVISYIEAHPDHLRTEPQDPAIDRVKSSPRDWGHVSLALYEAERSNETKAGRLAVTVNLLPFLLEQDHSTAFARFYWKTLSSPAGTGSPDWALFATPNSFDTSALKLACQPDEIKDLGGEEAIEAWFTSAEIFEIYHLEIFEKSKPGSFTFDAKSCQLRAGTSTLTLQKPIEDGKMITLRVSVDAFIAALHNILPSVVDTLLGAYDATLVARVFSAFETVARGDSEIEAAEIAQRITPEAIQGAIQVASLIALYRLDGDFEDIVNRVTDDCWWILRDLLGLGA